MPKPRYPRATKKQLRMQRSREKWRRTRLKDTRNIGGPITIKHIPLDEVDDYFKKKDEAGE